MSDLSTERLQAMLDASTGGRWAAEIIPGDIGPRCFVVIMDPSGAPDDDVDILADAYGVPDDAHLMALAPDLAREVLRLRAEQDTARADERARIVAHLRERAARYGRDGCAEPPGSRLMDLLAAADAALTLAADAIERGEVDDD